MEFNKEQIEKIINFGALGYSPKKIASILEIDIDEVQNAMNDKNSEMFKLIQKGKDVSDYVIDLKLFQMAQSGDLKALEKLEARKKLNK